MCRFPKRKSVGLSRFPAIVHVAPHPLALSLSKGRNYRPLRGMFMSESPSEKWLSDISSL